MRVTTEDIHYKTATKTMLIPAGTPVTPATNLPEPGQYWANSWHNMDTETESHHRNYGFLIREDETTEDHDLKLIHLDTCYPDYFRGYHEPVIAIWINNQVTADEFIEMVADEYHMIYDHLTYNGEWPDLTDDQIRQLAADLLTVKGNDLVFPDLEDCECEDECECEIYTYLALSK